MVVYVGEIRKIHFHCTLPPLVEINQIGLDLSVKILCLGLPYANILEVLNTRICQVRHFGVNYAQHTLPFQTALLYL